MFAYVLRSHYPGWSDDQIFDAARRGGGLDDLPGVAMTVERQRRAFASAPVETTNHRAR